MYVTLQGEFQENKLSGETPTPAARKWCRSQPARRNASPDECVPGYAQNLRALSASDKRDNSQWDAGAFQSPGVREGRVGGLELTESWRSSFFLKPTVWGEGGVMDLEFPEPMQPHELPACPSAGLVCWL